MRLAPVDVTGIALPSALQRVCSGSNSVFCFYHLNFSDIGLMIIPRCRYPVIEEETESLREQMTP